MRHEHVSRSPTFIELLLTWFDLTCQEMSGNGFPLRYAKGFRPYQNAGINRTLPPTPRARSHRFETVFLECSATLSDFKAASLDRSLFFSFSFFLITFDCPVEDCLFRQHVVKFSAD